MFQNEFYPAFWAIKSATTSRTPMTNDNDRKLPLSREMVRAAFDARGQSVSSWAEAHGFKPGDVYALLNGRTSGKRGNTHAIAVALGMKIGITE